MKGKQKIQVDGGEDFFCFALHSYLLEPEGEPAIVPVREEEEEDESLFIYAYNLPQDLTVFHRSDSGGRENYKIRACCRRLHITH